MNTSTTALFGPLPLGKQTLEETTEIRLIDGSIKAVLNDDERSTFYAGESRSDTDYLALPPH